MIKSIVAVSLILINTHTVNWVKILKRALLRKNLKSKFLKLKKKSKRQVQALHESNVKSVVSSEVYCQKKLEKDDFI